MTMATFTDRATVDDNTFTAGRLSLSATPQTSVLDVAAMAPGDSATNPITLADNGDLPLRYALTVSGTNADGKGLRDQLQLVIRTKTANACSAFDGTVLYNGTLSAGAIGDPATGAQAGDRTLAGGGQETLCVRVTLPASTGNAFQGAATSVAFTFDAEQTDNNP